MLGFHPGKTGNFTIEATDISHIDSDLKVILIDKVTKTEQELTVGNAYNFTSDATATDDRFSIVFKTSSNNTDISQTANKENMTVYCNQNNRIMVICNDNLNSNASVNVSNTVGQSLIKQNLTGTITEINKAFIPGIYVVKVNNGKLNITKKISIN
jgi:hypothetical protein